MTAASTTARSPDDDDKHTRSLAATPTLPSSPTTMSQSNDRINGGESLTTAGSGDAAMVDGAVIGGVVGGFVGGVLLTGLIVGLVCRRRHKSSAPKTGAVEMNTARNDEEPSQRVSTGVYSTIPQSAQTGYVDLPKSAPPQYATGFDL